MTPEAREFMERVTAADRLFVLGRFEASYQAARALLDEGSAAGGDREAQWRAELLGLAGRSALHLDRLDEALDFTRQALDTIYKLQNDALHTLLEYLRENLLTIVAALESTSPAGDSAGSLEHRAIRQQILRAQALTDRYRFAESIDALEPLLRGLQSLAPLRPDSPAASEPADVRLWYLPRVLGLLGFNWFYRADLDRARELTGEALEACRALGDKTGERVYTASVERIEEELRESGSP